MFSTLREMTIIAGAVFVGATYSTIWRMYAMSTDHPYMWMWLSMGAVLGLAFVAGIPTYLRMRKMRNLIPSNWISGTQPGGCCQQEIDVVGCDTQKGDEDGK